MKGYQNNQFEWLTSWWLEYFLTIEQTE
jgi:hypothetical protein